MTNEVNPSPDYQDNREKSLFEREKGELGVWDLFSALLALCLQDGTLHSREIQAGGTFFAMFASSGIGAGLARLPVVKKD